MVTFLVLQLHALCCHAYWENGAMSGVDWKSEEAYENFKKAEAVDIAWEWLRRDRNYQRDYQSLLGEQPSRDVTGAFRRQWGLSFRS